MFAAVMLQGDNAKLVLERILNVKIKKATVYKEKSIVYNPEYKGVRLDVLLADEAGTRFDIEMQVARDELMKRSRYYHSEIDAEILSSGSDYDILPKVYVIFICDFDPFGRQKYRYSLKKSLVEDNSVEYDDGEYTIFLSTKGKNDTDESQEVINFLRYVAGGDGFINQNPDSEISTPDELVSRLQQSVNEIKQSRELGGRYMSFEALFRNERLAARAEGKAEGKAESILDLLSLRNLTNDEINSKVLSITDLEKLNAIFTVAATATTIEEVEAVLKKLLVIDNHF